MSFTRNQKRKRRRRAWPGHVAGIVATGALPRPIAHEIFPVVVRDREVGVVGVRVNADGTVTLPERMPESPLVVRWDDATSDPIAEILAESQRQKEMAGQPPMYTVPYRDADGVLRFRLEPAERLPRGGR